MQHKKGTEAAFQVASNIHATEHIGSDNKPHAESRSELPYWLRLVRDSRWSTRQKHQLLAHFASPKSIYQLAPEQLTAVLSGRRKTTIEPNNAQIIEKDLAWLEYPQHHFVSCLEHRFPALLKEICDPPIGFFAKGNLEYLKSSKISMVGSRRPSPAGEKIAAMLAGGLAQLGVVITSGMALGIDGVAHRACLDSGAATIAVMGSGLDVIYPSRHRALFDHICERGLVLSEYPLGHPVSKYTFPQRNRIVSGLSFGTIVVEAAARSGTSITARLCMEQNRELMVVPGSPLNPQYEDSHTLIRDGAALVASLEDVLHVVANPLQSALSDQASLRQNEQNSTAAEPCSALLQHIDFDATPLDRIILAQIPI